MAARLYICNCKNPTSHCYNYCRHGSSPHPIDECRSPEYCDITGEKIQCKVMGKRALKKYYEWKGTS